MSNLSKQLNRNNNIITIPNTVLVEDSNYIDNKVIYELDIFDNNKLSKTTIESNNRYSKYILIIKDQYIEKYHISPKNYFVSEKNLGEQWITKDIIKQHDIEKIKDSIKNSKDNTDIANIIDDILDF